MKIIHTLKDLGFKAKNLDDLKHQLVEFYSFKGYQPKVDIVGEYVVVELDMDSMMEVEAKIDEAEWFCKEGKWDEAERRLDAVVKVCPLYSEAYRLKAQIKYMREDYDGAMDDDVEALKLDPKNVWALVLMGNIYSKSGRGLDVAKDYYDTALEYDSKNVVVINNIAAVAVENGDYERAVELMKKALEVDDSYGNSWYGLAMAYYRMGDVEGAFEAARKGNVKMVERVENPRLKEEMAKMMMQVGMELAKGKNYMDLARRIAKGVEGKSGIKTEFVEEGVDYGVAQLKYAPHCDLKRNRVRFDSKKPYYEHAVLHELMHLELLTDNSLAGKGKMAVSSDEQFRGFRKRFTTWYDKLCKMSDADKAKEMFEYFFRGMGTRLLNAAMDLFVEQKIFEEHKEARAVQMLSMFEMEQENIKSIIEVAPLMKLPPVLAVANKVLNMVQSIQFKELYGINLLGYYKPTKAEMGKAEDFYEEYKAYKETYTAGDEYFLMEYFMYELDLDGMIELTDEAKFMLGRDVAKAEEQTEMERIEAEQSNRDFRENHGDGEDVTETTMMSMYMLGALEYFEDMGKAKIKQIAMEIAMVGMKGISPNKEGYEVHSMPGRKFGGYEFLAYYYVSWAVAIPEMLDKLGLPYSEAYKMALGLYNAKNK